MPKPSLQAAAEGLPAVSRRRFLTASASALVAGQGMAITAIPSAAEPFDPLLDLVRRYEAEERRFNATPHPNEGDAEADIARLGELHDELCDRCPAGTTRAGAIAALTLASNFLTHSCGGFEHSLIAAALAYLEGSA